MEEHTTTWIVVDDTDSRIEYHGDWVATTDADNEGGREPGAAGQPSGGAFNHTLHRALSTTGTSFTFKFNGSSLLLVYGSSYYLPGDTGILLDSYAVSCSWVTEKGDGRSFEGTGKPDSETVSPLNNNQELCRFEELYGAGSPGEHELMFEVETLSGAALYFDYLVYEPLLGAITDGDTLQIGNPYATYSQFDPRLQDTRFSFSPDWDFDDSSLGLDMAKTTTPGAFVTVKFNGTAIELYGVLTSNFSDNTATYQLDDLAPESFELQSPSNQNLTNQLFFNHSGIPPGEHTVIVTHNGSSTAMPLMVQYFLATSLTSEEQASPSPSSSLSPANSRIRIIGGVIGGVVGLVLLLLGIIWIIWIQRKRRHRQERDSTGLTPVSTASAPFTSTSSAPFISTSSAPFISTSSAPFISTSSAPFISTSSAPFISTSSAPFISTSSAPFISTSSAPFISTSSSLIPPPPPPPPPHTPPLHHDADAVPGPYNARRWGRRNSSTTTGAGAVKSNSPPLPRPSNGSQERKRELNDTRFGNLKFLQRFEPLRRLLTASVAGPDDARLTLGRTRRVEREETDSGWRQQSDDVDGDIMVQIRPPRYTEA
ncbi:hypothetical protein D9758_006542 [Tetrapyrgos nigripes]|uniref:Transmembrane protein n=1 Tax=Tetrapyrgos nigripes TaxID=182062 RepID=A0A8H5GL75_9AGAR|nr:hypothetical protein D9758_006542 [Tetrapyrgos nigripes]